MLQIKNDEKRDVCVAFEAVLPERTSKRRDALLTTVLTVKALDTSSGVNHALATRPKGVCRRRDMHFYYVVLHTVDIPSISTRHRRTGNDLVVTVYKDDRMVFWMNIGFHSEPHGSARRDGHEEEK